MAEILNREQERVVVAELKELQARRAVNRRNFMAGLGLASASLAGASLLSGCSTAGSANGSSGTVIAAGPSETDVLNFALNLEYLEASFYVNITQGTDLPSGLTTGQTGSVTNAPGKLTFPTQLITDLINEIAYDELSHVSDLRTALGSLAVARPAINLAAAGMVTASNYLTIARQFEDVGVTAYAGAAALLTATNLTYAAQILAVEAFHSGALRLLSIQTGAPYAAADPMDVKPNDPGSAAAAYAGPTAAGSFFATAGATTETMAVLPGFAFTRTTTQVLAIVYASTAATPAAGGFFPSGLNGNIK